MNAIALALMLVALWAVTHRYQGLARDGELYAFQALATIHPALGADLYLQNGSQDHYSIFSRIYAPLIRSFGLQYAELLLFIPCTAWFLAAAWVLARALGKVPKKGDFFENDDYVISSAVGHIVELQMPEDIDKKKYGFWRLEMLPIIPEKFEIKPIEESKARFDQLKKLLARKDIGEVINACDAGREGELIFAYLYEKAKAKKPVQRLWLNSMTNAAMKAALGSLRPAEELASLEQAARSRSEADWIVGMNATRAATIRLRSSFDGAVSLGRVQTPTLAIVARREEEIKAFKPEPYWLVDATFAAGPLADADADDGERSEPYPSRHGPVRQHRAPPRRGIWRPECRHWPRRPRRRCRRPNLRRRRRPSKPAARTVIIRSKRRSSAP